MIKTSTMNEIGKVSDHGEKRYFCDDCKNYGHLYPCIEPGCKQEGEQMPTEFKAKREVYIWDKTHSFLRTRTTHFKIKGE